MNKDVLFYCFTALYIFFVFVLCYLKRSVDKECDLWRDECSDLRKENRLLRKELKELGDELEQNMEGEEWKYE